MKYEMIKRSLDLKYDRAVKHLIDNYDKPEILTQNINFAKQNIAEINALIRDLMSYKESLTTLKNLATDFANLQNGKGNQK